MSFSSVQACKQAEAFMEKNPVDTLPAVIALKEITCEASCVVAECHVQFVEAGIVYALKHLQLNKQKDKKKNKDKDGDGKKCKDPQEMKHIISDQHGSLMKGDYGAKSADAQRLLMQEASKYL